MTQCFFGSDTISIGDRSYISVGCFLDGSASIRIGNDVHLAAGVQVWTSTHELGPSARRAGSVVAKDTVIEDGCWIGAGAIILAGATVGSGAVVGAGSVVLTDVSRDTMVVGTPARHHRRLEI